MMKNSEKDNKEIKSQPNDRMIHRTDLISAASRIWDATMSTQINILVVFCFKIHEPDISIDWKEIIIIDE